MLQVFVSLSLLANVFVANPDRERWLIDGTAQGTTYRVLYYHTDSLMNKSTIDSIFTSIDSSISVYQHHSLINKFNSSTKGIKVDRHFERLVLKSLDVNRLSKGAFDITIKSLVEAWGFGVEQKHGLPEDAEIKRLLKQTGMNKISLKNGHLLKSSPEIEIDINGIGQGYSVDVIAEFLEHFGIERYLVEVGGELRSKGGKPGSNSFTVGIESPDEEGNSITRAVAITDGAITTSGTYRRYLTSNGRRLSHLIDPSTGYPINNNLLSVTVFARDAATADGFDNVFMVWGLEKSLKMLAEQTELGAYFIYMDKNGIIKDTVAGKFPTYNLN